MDENSLKDLLNLKVERYNQPSFIEDDPLGIPHRFTKKQDIEIAGFFAAILAWGNRKSIVNSCDRLLILMDNSPYDFIMTADWNNEPRIFLAFGKFVHRTFNERDLWHLLNFLKYHYFVKGEQSLETAFTKWMLPGDETVENALIGFHEYVFGFDEDAKEERHCRKHIASPSKKSACKRLNMFLRWMVRDDKKGVDFGLWKNVSSSQLICPIDVHVSRVAKKLNLLTRNQTDWQSAKELTAYLRKFDKDDPVKYDFALFGLGVMEHY
ncbi:MAG: TIGR02757 family protein [Ferruginibacter sp.]|nr:TIGR02757 family protein [Ferruginibacter sp.]